ncbi:hypothetical protein AYO40_00185 [Planctomycetaceae bacterium SCGC AG-212-D15]|nr:hypothetical protein AYO40_00185 [Planctomycetaceae bacterium SCGC AG-212-D15]
MLRSYAAALLTGLAGWAALADEAPRPASAIADKDLVTTVDTRVKERQPAPADRAFDAIGWARTVVDAQKLATEHQRPVFLFTHDGRMNFGRC